jgi:acetylornithine/succinyldiaminopimelate/putrescine aminotransferase
MGGVLHEALLDLGAKEVRGLGLMQAFEFAEPRAKALQQACLDAGLIINAVDENSVRLVPPLIIGTAEIDKAHSILRKAVAAGRRPIST